MWASATGLCSVLRLKKFCSSNFCNNLIFKPVVPNNYLFHPNADDMINNQYHMLLTDQLIINVYGIQHSII